MSDGVEAITGIPAAEFLRPNGRVWADLVVPEDLEKVKWVVEEGVTHGKPFEMEYRICRPDESIRWVFERGQAIYDEGGGPRWLDVVIIDITALKQGEEALRDNETRFKLLSETAERLLTAADPQGIVNDLCRDVMDHLGCQVFVNFLVDEEAGRLHLNACAGIPEEEARKIEWLDYGTVVCDCVARDGAPIVAGNICNTPDLRTEWVKSYGVQAYACHPLVVQGKLIGTLSFGTKTRKSFSLEQLALMRTVTDQVATAMERMSLIKELHTSREELEMRVKERTADLAQANEALRQLSARVLSAQEDERKRVAGDIHDTLGSSLNAIRFRVETASSAASESLNALMPVVREAVEECRRMQQDLRPSMLDDLGILATLSWFCRRFGTTYPGIRVEQKIGVQESEAPDSLKTPIFRITQEAMNNIAKHSKADLIILSLKGEGKRIELTIQDNGMGFDVEGMLSRGRSQRGLGLESMRERVELSGGAFTIESTHGQGTLIRASWGI
jgi:PAS domain S-box-containing protein